MSKDEVVAFCQAEIERFREKQKEAQSISEVVSLAIEIRKYTELVCELKGFLNRYPQVNVEMPREGGVYGNN